MARALTCPLGLDALAAEAKTAAAAEENGEEERARGGRRLSPRHPARAGNPNAPKTLTTSTPPLATVRTVSRAATRGGGVFGHGKDSRSGAASASALGSAPRLARFGVAGRATSGAPRDEGAQREPREPREIEAAAEEAHADAWAPRRKTLELEARAQRAAERRKRAAEERGKRGSAELPVAVTATFARHCLVWCAATPQGTLRRDPITVLARARFTCLPFVHFIILGHGQILRSCGAALREPAKCGGCMQVGTLAPEGAPTSMVGAQPCPFSLSLSLSCAPRMA